MIIFKKIRVVYLTLELETENPIILKIFNSFLMMIDHKNLKLFDFYYIVYLYNIFVALKILSMYINVNIKIYINFLRNIINCKFYKQLLINSYIYYRKFFKNFILSYFCHIVKLSF